MTIPGMSDFPPKSYTVSCAVGFGILPFAPTAVMRSPSTTTVVLALGAFTPSMRLAPRKKIRPMVKTLLLLSEFKIDLVFVLHPLSATELSLSRESPPAWQAAASWSIVQVESTARGRKWILAQHLLVQGDA